MWPIAMKIKSENLPKNNNKKKLPDILCQDETEELSFCNKYFCRMKWMNEVKLPPSLLCLKLHITNLFTESRQNPSSPLGSPEHIK